MIQWGSIRRSFSQFATNPMRTLLTLLGIVFGVGSVVAMVSVGEGAQKQILASIEAMGATTTHIKALSVPDSELTRVVNDSAGLSRADARVLTDLHKGVTAVAWRKKCEVQVTDLPIPARSLQVMGTNADLFEAHNLNVAHGRALTTLDDRRAHRVAVIGADLAREVFPEGAIGRQIRLEYAFFEVVGVLSGSGTEGEELPVDPEVYNRAVLVPFETSLQQFRPLEPYNELDLISLKVQSTAQTLELKQLMIPVLQNLHGKVDDFEVISPEEILQQRKAAQAVLNMVLISIAAISLVVGGIGIMNIMLANIMERISEIGLRRAIGARKRDIRNQFLLESVLVCFVGGVLGLILGLGGGAVVSWVAEIPMAFAWESMVLSFGISLLVGVIFGIVPAIRAANIDPIEALRGE